MKPTRGRLPLDADLRGMPIRIATNGIVTRSVRDTAAFYREMERTVPGRSMRPVGDVRGPGGRRLRVAVVTRSLQSDSSPEVRDETLRVATVLEGLGHHVEHLDAPPVPASFVDDFLLYWALLALAIVRAGRRLYDPSFDPRQLDDVTHGLADRAVRHLHRVPAALLRLSRCHAISRAHYETHDVLLTPTLAKAPLPIGELDPQGDFASWSERVLQWVAFTPWQNVTGEPSLSLPTGRSATGAPIGTLLSGPRGQEATLLQLGYELEGSGWGRLGG